MPRFLSSAPVLATAWLIFTSVLMIVANYLFPDLLFYPG